MNWIVRLPNWVGDTLLALPAVAGLREAHPGRLWLAGRDAPLQLARIAFPDLPAIPLRAAHDPAELVRSAAGARRTGSQAGLLLVPSFSAALWLWLARLRRRVGWAAEGRSALLTRALPRPVRGSRHLRDEFIDLAREAQGERFPDLPELPSDPATRAAAQEFLAPLGEAGERAPLIALCPGARYGSAKQWPLSQVSALARRLAQRGARGVVVGTAAEGAAAARIVAAA
ncbi:MAG: hypothetical protein KAY32_04180, partial [Candidatus Eisenbacteria sp.]|nr:hypothetical protein [Candidatus Eisenbacteria bacterium]